MMPKTLCGFCIKYQNWPRQRLNYLHKLIAEFWKKQSFENKTAKQQRKKNHVEEENLKKGDLIYITDDNNHLYHGHLESRKICAGNDSL